MSYATMLALSQDHGEMFPFDADEEAIEDCACTD